MRRFALLLGVAFSIAATSAGAQNCDGFVDVLASSPFCPDVTWMKTYGITKGCDATHYCPTDNVSRLQMAAFIHRLGENPAFVNGGNAFGTTAVLGPTDNQTLILQSGGFTVFSLATGGNASYVLAANVVGGLGINSATGAVGATIGGGGCIGGPNCLGGTQPNLVTADFGTIGGGRKNTAGNLATVGGGLVNTASGTQSTVAGGFSNTANSISDTVSGGDNNLASGGRSTVAGGQSNTASGFLSTVAGGNSNTAGGAASFAAGNFANAGSDGCFVWSDFSTTNPTNCGVANAFVARAMGGVYLLTGGTYPAYTGALLAAGSTSWTTYSDRNGKEHIVAVDPREVLSKVAALPIATWNWKSQDAAVRHMGPMAQDFAAAFGLGETPRGINTVDSEGVALAAIKGLYELHERTEAELRAKDREITALRQELEAIKAALNLH
jgi:hypothetical protein